MTISALVPGKWVDDWAWRNVTDRLRTVGHDVSCRVSPTGCRTGSPRRWTSTRPPVATGKSHFGIHPTEAIEGMAGHVREHGDGWRLPAPHFAEMAARPGGEGLTGEQC
ncbi:hypothetical protein [Streptomyces murinus]|uniref:hypothetical protein n=1 Tax=Streptomyces murinus TaxID=33900 RepID=UPI00381F588C